MLTDADPYLTDIPLEAAITGIGIADDNSVFAYLPAIAAALSLQPADAFALRIIWFIRATICLNP
jgi:uncharacterized circularly permuted ATP-grasp superfamily protein